MIKVAPSLGGAGIGWLVRRYRWDRSIRSPGTLPSSQMVVDDWKWIMSAPLVTTWTLTSANLPTGTVAITCKVVETVESAMEHVRAMGAGKPEPTYDYRSYGPRWTWETVGLDGTRCTDTVRIYPA